MIEYLILETIFLMAVFFQIVIVHEMGHYLFLRMYKKKSKVSITYIPKERTLKVGHLIDYKYLTHRQYIIVNLAGIIAGTLMIVYWSFYINNIIILAFLVIHTVGCKTDIKNILGIKRA